MKKCSIYKGLLDAFANSLLLFGINTFFLTIYAVNFSVEKCIFIEFAVAIMLSILFFISIFKENNKNILEYIIVSICSFPFFSILIIIIYYLIPFDKSIYFYDDNNAGGLLCMICSAIFLITSIILKVIITACLLVKNKKTRNGSASRTQVNGSSVYD